MNIRAPSTHLFRDKKSDDALEGILEPWGMWRGWGVDGLSSPRKSPLEGLNQLCRDRTDCLDRQRKDFIIQELVKLGYHGEMLKEQARKEYRELTYKINQLILPKETRKTVAKSPNYGGHKYYAKIDRILSGIYGPYYNILIRRYEDLWELNIFMREWGKDLNYVSKNVGRARKAARKELKKNGYRV